MMRARISLVAWVATLGPVCGAVTPARAAAVAYHFDRNAFAATVRLEHGRYIVLTDSGNLLRFDPS